MDKVQKIYEVVEKRYECWKEKELNSHSIESEIRMSECKHLLLMLNSLQEEPVSEDLEDAALQYLSKHYDTNIIWDEDVKCVVRDFKAGANWQKDRMMLNTIDATCFGFQGSALFSFRLPADNYLVGSEVKLIVIKED